MLFITVLSHKLIFFKGSYFMIWPAKVEKKTHWLFSSNTTASNIDLLLLHSDKQK